MIDGQPDVWNKDGTVNYDVVQGNNPAGGGEYPKMLYRAGGSENLHGFDVYTMIVDNEDDEENMASSGWRTTPKKAHALKPPEEAPIIDRVDTTPTEGPRRGRPPKNPLAQGDEI